MLKHGLAFITLSIIAMLFLPQLTAFLHLMGHAYGWLADKLFAIFSDTQMGKLISHVLALMGIPLIIALIPAFFYWIVRRHEMPYFAMLLWLVWVMLVTIVAFV